MRAQMVEHDMYSPCQAWRIRVTALIVAAHSASYRLGSRKLLIRDLVSYEMLEGSHSYLLTMNEVRDRDAHCSASEGYRHA